MIDRLAGSKIMELSQSFKAVAVIGPRQSGKTTLVKACFPEKPYVSLENPDQRNFAIEDPRNLGACLRSADAAGVDLVIFPKHKAAGLTATARKTAAGAAETLRIYQVTNIVSALEILKNNGIWVAGTDCEADSKSIYQSDLTGALALVMGNEGKGIRPLVKKHCDFLVHIPMAGTVQSLNISVATGITLFEALRQRTQS